MKNKKIQHVLLYVSIALSFISNTYSMMRTRSLKLGGDDPHYQRMLEEQERRRLELIFTPRYESEFDRMYTEQNFVRKGNVYIPKKLLYGETENDNSRVDDYSSFTFDKSKKEDNIGRKHLLAGIGSIALLGAIYYFFIYEYQDTIYYRISDFFYNFRVKYLNK